MSTLTSSYAIINNKKCPLTDGYVKVLAPQLPSGYSKIEYIQSSGTQYINTNYSANNTTRVKMKFEYLSGDVVFGAYDNSSGSNGYGLQAVSGKWYTYYGTASGTSSTAVVANTPLEIDINRNITSLNGTVIRTATANTFQASNPLLLSCIYNATNIKYYTSLKIYSCQIYDNDKLVRNFMPCTNSTGEVGLYDVVTKSFYKNAGTGTFTAGPTVTTPVSAVWERIINFSFINQSIVSRLPEGYTELRYVASTGDQHINTGFNPKYNTRLVMDVSDVTGTAAMLCGARGTASTTDSTQFAIYRSDTTQVRSDYFGTNSSTTISDTTSRTTIDKNGNVVTLWGKTITNTAVSSGQCNYPIYLFALNSAGSATLPTSFKLYSCKIYDGNTLVRDFIPCKSPKGIVGLYDVVNNVFYGDGNKFIAGSPVYKIAATPLSAARYGLAATPVGDYALFGGGYASGSYSRVVDAYDKSLVQTIPTTLYEYSTDLAASSIGNYAIFAGGRGGYYSSYSNELYSGSIYNNSLTRTTFSNIDAGGVSPSGASNDTYAIFAGGYDYDANAINNGVTAFNTSLTRTHTTLNTGRQRAMSTSVGNYVIIAGGNDSPSSSTSCTSTVEVFDNSLTRSSTTALSQTMQNGGATRVGNYAIIAGGSKGSYPYLNDLAFAYNESLTRTKLTALSAAKSSARATSVGGYALFSIIGTDIIDIYNESLTKAISSKQSNTKSNTNAATSIGDYALFGGGYGNSTYLSTVDVYTVI